MEGKLLFCRAPPLHNRKTFQISFSVDTKPARKVPATNKKFLNVSLLKVKNILRFCQAEHVILAGLHCTVQTLQCQTKFAKCQHKTKCCAPTVPS